MKNQPPMPSGNPVYIYPEDETSLIDLWLIVTKRKQVFWSVFGFFIVAGLILSLTKANQNQYEVTTVIEIGAIVQEDSLIPLESSGSVKAKLEEAFIPKILYKNNADRKHEKIKASIPTNSGIIVLKGKATEETIKDMTAIQTEIITALTHDHDRILRVHRAKITDSLLKSKSELELLKDKRSGNPEKKAIESQLKKATIKLALLQDKIIQKQIIKSFEIKLDNEKNNLASLKTKETVLYSKNKRINKIRDLLEKQIKELEYQISSATELKKRSVKDAKGATQAMVLLMIENEIQQNRNRLSTLEERLYIGIENQYSETTKNIEDNLRQQKHQASLIDQEQQNINSYLRENELKQETQASNIAQIKAVLSKLEIDQKQKILLKTQEINKLNNNLSNLIETKAVTPPLYSQDSTGTSGKTIMALSGILGIILGLFCTFIAEFLSKARTQQKETEIKSNQTT